jgi:3-isopropylmalate/(R)-2-methylmalate dehydratase small subunit
MEPFTTLTSRVVVLPNENVDTDQIIPARFLKATDKVGMGDHLFADWRYDSQGQPKPDFVLNRPESRGCQVLLVGDNFGCGSSREHAPWALVGYGFRAVISTSFADIFRNNALKNGLLPVILDVAAHRRLADLLAADPAGQVMVDLAAQTLRLPDGSAVTFPLDGFSRDCLLEGVDQLGYLLKHDAQISAYETSHPAAVTTVG